MHSSQRPRGHGRPSGSLPQIPRLTIACTRRQGARSFLVGGTVLCSLARVRRSVGHQTCKPQETKGRRTPCHPWSLATPRPHGPTPARGTWCPRTQVVPKNTIGAQSPWSVLRPIVSAQAHCQCPSPWSVLRAWSVFRPMGSVPTHGQCSNPWAVFRPMGSAKRMVSALAHGQCSGPWAVPRPIVSAQVHGQSQASCQCSGPLSVPGACSVLRPMVGTPAQGQYSGAWSVLKSMVGTQTDKTADRRPAPRSTRPNKAVEATGHKIRCWPSQCPWGVARASPLAFGAQGEEASCP